MLVKYHNNTVSDHLSPDLSCNSQRSLQARAIFVVVVGGPDPFRFSKAPSSKLAGHLLPPVPNRPCSDTKLICASHLETLFFLFFLLLSYRRLSFSPPLFFRRHQTARGLATERVFAISALSSVSVARQLSIKSACSPFVLRSPLPRRPYDFHFVIPGLVPE